MKKPLLVLGIILFTFGIALNFGSEKLILDELTDPGSPSARLLFELRLPRVILAFFVGGSLAVLGATYQILFQNPLAEPYILGVSSAAILGIASAELLVGAAALSLASVLFGMVGALAVALMLVALCLTRWGGSLERVVLFGLGVNFVLSSLILLLMSYVQQSTGGGSLRWIFGQIPWVSLKESMLFFGVVVPLLAGLWLFGRKLDALSLGETVARTLGVAVLRVRVILLLLTSSFIAFTAAFTGSIGFVGLVVPHIVRLWFVPENTRSLFQVCFLLGGAFVVLADLFSRVLLPPLEFPIGIFTTLLGGPLFLLLLWRRSS